MLPNTSKKSQQLANRLIESNRWGTMICLDRFFFENCLKNLPGLPWSAIPRSRISCVSCESSVQLHGKVVAAAEFSQTLVVSKSTEWLSPNGHMFHTFSPHGHNMGVGACCDVSCVACFFTKMLTCLLRFIGTLLDGRTYSNHIWEGCLVLNTIFGCCSKVACLPVKRKRCWFYHQSWFKWRETLRSFWSSRIQHHLPGAWSTQEIAP